MLDDKEKNNEKLTEKNLKTLNDDSSKPKWALTAEQAEEQENKEVDNLLSFVHSLDYDEFINDLEIRQALEIVKERVSEIKQDKQWKQQIAEKYNQDEANNDAEWKKNIADKYNAEKTVASKDSIKSYASKAKSQIDKNLEGDEKKEAEWDKSVKNI